MSDAKNILVVANETVVGRELIEAVKRHADTLKGTGEGEVSVHVICPQSAPRHGYVIHEGDVRMAAENRVATAVAQLSEAGIEATGEVMDPDPYAAITDALSERRYDAIIVSTHPETRSGWLREDLITRVTNAVDCPVEHVVVDLDAEKDQVTRTLVVANQTVGGQALIDQLRELSEEGPRRFIVISPQSGEDTDEAHERLAATIKRLEEEGIRAIGQVTHPDPYTAIQNALDFYGIDEIVISTFPETRSGWMRGDLVGRVQTATSKPVHHVVSEGDGETAEPKEAHPASGGDRQS